MICSHCKKECDVVLIDEGIGCYEFWGFGGRHIDLRESSSCCGEDVEESVNDES